MAAPDLSEIDFFVASRIGSFKHVKYYTDPAKNSKKCIENLVDIKSLTKEDAISCMVWGGPDQTEIILAKKNKKCEVYSTVTGKVLETHVVDFTEADIVGLGRKDHIMLAADACGVIRVWQKHSQMVILSPKCIDVLKQCDDERSFYATGGEEHDLKVWTLGEPEPIFKGKNLPNDSLQLRQPVWVSDLCFLPGEGGNVIAVCSRRGYVRLYDTRAQRRPVSHLDAGNMAATCVSPGFQHKQVLVGFGRGQLHNVDLRAARLDKGYKGCCGAVTAAHALPGGLLVSTSLDRHLRVHDFNTKEVVYKQYLTSKLTHVLAQSARRTPLAGAAVLDADDSGEAARTELDENMDDLFDKMEMVESNRSVNTEVVIRPHEAAIDPNRIKPSTEGATEPGPAVETEVRILKLLKSTERQKRHREKKRLEKRAKSVFHNA